MKVAFLCWNPFQIYQFANVIKKFKDSYNIIIINKGKNIKEFNLNELKKQGYNYSIIPKKYVTSIDGVYDILFFQSPFPYIEDIKISKLISIQYGLAKERHNYGEWRALADMNLMYGKYSKEIVDNYSPSYYVGNPKFENWKDYQKEQNIMKYKKSLNIPLNQKVVLYMPTWGELGSFEELCNHLSQLQDNYTVLLKMHHNNEHALKNWVKQAQSYNMKYIFHGDYDQLKLLAVSDIVISDFSGAIFDAMFAKKPIVLFQNQPECKVDIQKFNLNSIEFRERTKIGFVCTEAKQIKSAVEIVLKEPQKYINLYNDLSKNLFMEDNSLSTSQLIYDYSLKLLNKQIPELSFTQKCVRETVQNLRRILRKE